MAQKITLDAMAIANKRKASKQSAFYNVEDVMEMLECSKAKAYMVIKMLNTELTMKGKLTTNGRVSKKYFDERYYN